MKDGKQLRILTKVFNKKKFKLMKIFDSMLNAVDKLVDSEVNVNDETVVNEEETTGEGEQKKSTWKWVAVTAASVLVVAASIWGGRKLILKNKAAKETGAEEPEKKEE